MEIMVERPGGLKWYETKKAKKKAAQRLEQELAKGRRRAIVKGRIVIPPSPITDVGRKWETDFTPVTVEPAITPSGVEVLPVYDAEDEIITPEPREEPRAVVPVDIPAPRTVEPPRVFVTEREVDPPRVARHPTHEVCPPRPRVMRLREIEPPRPPFRSKGKD